VKGGFVDNLVKETPSSYYMDNACPVLMRPDVLGGLPDGARQKASEPSLR
jgi:hypothetical protein